MSANVAMKLKTTSVNLLTSQDVYHNSSYNRVAHRHEHLISLVWTSEIHASFHPFCQLSIIICLVPEEIEFSTHSLPGMPYLAVPIALHP